MHFWDIPLNKKSYTPLYLQIAEVIEYQIATGKIRKEQRLPSIRDLAELWRVNMHTVRHAYKELETRRLIRIDRPSGVFIRENIPAGALDNPLSKFDAFIVDFVARAKKEFNLSPFDLVARLQEKVAGNALPTPQVTFIECSNSQIMDHKKEIEDIWDVNIIPWPVDKVGELPPGPVVATYFHYNDIRTQWPRRFHQVVFVAIQPDPGLNAFLWKKFGKDAPLRVILCDQDEKKSLAIQADLEQILPAARYALQTKIIKHANELLSNMKAGVPCLFTPRVWAQLSQEEQSHPQVIKVVYKILPESLAALGSTLRWKKRSSTGG